VSKLIAGLVILGAVSFALLRAGGGLSAVAGLGYIPASVFPARLRRFLFGEQPAAPFRQK
jgi:hypothetical protein